VFEMRISDLWAALPCRLVDDYQHLRGETKGQAEAFSSKTLKSSSYLHDTADQEAVIKNACLFNSHQPTYE